jgi:hypothetical protein
MPRPRPGFPSASSLPAPIRGVLEPVLDILSRAVLSSDLTQIKKITGRVATNLDPSTATTADVATRVNEIATNVQVAITKINEIITRLQEE